MALLGAGLLVGGCGTSAGDPAVPAVGSTADATTQTTQDPTPTTASPEASAVTSSASAATMTVDEFLALLEAPGEARLGSHRIVLDVRYEGGMGMGSGVQHLVVSVDERKDDPLLSVVADDDPASGMPGLTLIVREGVAYSDMFLQGMHPSEAPSADGAPVQLVEFPAADLDEIMPGILGSGSPITFVETVRDEWDVNAQSVTLLGSERKDGLTLDHYVVKLEESGLRQDEMSAFLMFWPSAETYHVWLDEDSLMRRVEATGGGGELVATLDRWGEPADVAAPDPSTVMTFRELEQTMGGLGGEFGGPGDMPIEIFAGDQPSAACSTTVSRVSAGEHVVIAITEGSGAVVEIVDEQGEVVFLHEKQPYGEERLTLHEGVYTVRCTYPDGFAAEDEVAVTDQE